MTTLALETTNNVIKPVRLKGWGFMRKKKSEETKPTREQKDMKSMTEIDWIAHIIKFANSPKEIRCACKHIKEQERKRCKGIVDEHKRLVRIRMKTNGFPEATIKVFELDYVKIEQQIEGTSKEKKK